MAARRKRIRPSLTRHAAPLAPVALALAMQATHTAIPHKAATGNFEAVCGLPFESVRNQDIDDECGIEGGSSDPAKQAESRAKNNFCASTKSLRSITYQDLVDLQKASTGFSKKLTDRSKLQGMGEGDYVSYIAFIKQAHYSNVSKGEAVNCNIPGKNTNDVHIVLMGDVNDQDECNSTTAEMSPHYRPAEWTPENLNALKNHPVRIQGQLFYDASHSPCTERSRPNPKRASLWEIHPVYAVDVCSEDTITACSSGNAHWMSLAEYFGSEEE